MKKNSKTKEQLMDELSELRGKLIELTSLEAEHMRTEEALRKSEEQFRTLVENLKVGVYRATAGAQGRFIQANPAIARVFGFDSAEEYMKRNVSDFYQDVEERRRFVEDLKRAGFVKNRELRLKKKDGTPILASVTSTAHYDEEGGIDWIDGIVEDITERRRTEEELRMYRERLEELVKERTDELEETIAAKKTVQGELNMAAAALTTVRGVIDEVLGNRKSVYSFDWLTNYMEKEHFRKDEVLFHKGDNADKIYFVNEGTLRVVEMAHSIGKGNIIGEMGVISLAKKRTTTIVCQEDVELYSLKEEKAREIFQRDPSVLFKLIQLSIERSLENLTTIVAEKERIEQDLRIAHDIQTSVLPRIFPPFPDRGDFDIYASMDPAREVGGDFYDFFLIGERKLCFVIGDVSGKGVPAALFMMMTKILIRAVASGDLPPGEILYTVNNVIAGQNDASVFVTILCAVLDTETGELEIGNAGHNPPLFSKAGTGRFEFVELPQSFVLGPMEGMTFSTARLVLSPDDLIFFYTDGVTEAMDMENKPFSAERLRAILSSVHGKSITEIVKEVRSAITDFVQGAPPSDDITMLMLKFQGQRRKRL